ncbi:hypothetical protein T4A_13072, partial [Trichinella pseudospiralis]
LALGSSTVLSANNQIGFTMHYLAPLSIVLLTFLIEVYYAEALFGRQRLWDEEKVDAFLKKAKGVTKRNEEKWEACFDYLYSVKCGQGECKELKDKVDSFPKNQRNSREFADAFKNFDKCVEECFERILKEKNLKEYHEQLDRLQIEGSV